MSKRIQDRTHLHLLAARKAARKDYPLGDPRRLIAEKAARRSQGVHRRMKEWGLIDGT